MDLSEEEKKSIEYLNGKSIEENIAIITKLITTKFNNDYSIDNKDKEAIEQLLLEYRNVMEENKILKNLHIRDVEHLENLRKMCILKSTIKEELNQYENIFKRLYERQEYRKIKLLNERIFALKKIIDENGDLLL